MLLLQIYHRVWGSYGQEYNVLFFDSQCRTATFYTESKNRHQTLAQLHEILTDFQTFSLADWVVSLQQTHV